MYHATHVVLLSYARTWYREVPKFNFPISQSKNRTTAVNDVHASGPNCHSCCLVYIENLLCPHVCSCCSTCTCHTRTFVGKGVMNCSSSTSTRCAVQTRTVRANNFSVQIFYLIARRKLPTAFCLMCVKNCAGLHLLFELDRILIVIHSFDPRLSFAGCARALRAHLRLQSETHGL